MTAHLTPAEAARLLARLGGDDTPLPPAPAKYRNEKATFDGKRFPSVAEATRWRDLLLMERAGEIDQLVYQPRYPLVVEGVRVATYVADARYRVVATGEIVVEDTKGVRTPVYKLKRRLVKALYKIDVREVG